MALGTKFLAVVMLVAAAVGAEGSATVGAESTAALTSATAPGGSAPAGAAPDRSAPAVPAPSSTTEAATPAIPAAVTLDDEDEDPMCARVRGAVACVGSKDSDRPGISIEDTEPDKSHAAIEYFLSGYLGTKYVIHNLAGDGTLKGTDQMGRIITFRAAVYKGDARIKAGRWKTVRNIAKNPVKRETRVTPAGARGRSEICTSTRDAATICFKERKTVVFACDTGTDMHQARAEYFVAGDPTTRFEIHQLAGYNTCGKAEHGDLAISMYRASLYDQDAQVATRLYKYN